MESTPAQTVEAMLAGMAVVGVDVAAIRARAGLPAGEPAPGDRWPRSVGTLAWEQAIRQFPRPGIAAEIGHAVPFGAFGAVDYLIASSETIDGALHALVAHFDVIASNPSLTRVDEGAQLRLEVRADAKAPAWIAEEFSLALILKNFRLIAMRDLHVTECGITRGDEVAEALSGLLAVRVRANRPVASLCIASEALLLPIRTADPFLRRTVNSLIPLLRLGSARDPLVHAIRARLRDLLRVGRPEAAAVARTLGMSERSLHRRLQELHTTWRDVVDGFRCDESKRLLRERRLALGEIAQALGFSEHSAWSRSFRRWTGTTPARWKLDPDG